MFKLVTFGLGQSWPQEHHVNKLGKGLQGDATCQISKPYNFQLQRGNILKIGFFVSMFQIVNPGAGPVMTLRASYEQLDRGPQVDAKYKISKLRAFHFQRRRILKIGFFVPMFQIVTPRGWATFDPRGIT